MPLSAELQLKKKLLIQIVKNDSDDNHEVTDHYILSTLAALPDDQRVKIIKEFIQCCIDEQVEEKALVNQNNDSQNKPISDNKEPVKVNTEIEDINDYNTKELIKLKVWVVKVAIIISLLVVVAVIIFILLLGNGTFNTATGLLNEIQAIYGYLTN